MITETEAAAQRLAGAQSALFTALLLEGPTPDDVAENRLAATARQLVDKRAMLLAATAPALRRRVGPDWPVLIRLWAKGRPPSGIREDLAALCAQLRSGGLEAALVEAGVTLSPEVYELAETLAEDRTGDWHGPRCPHTKIAARVQIRGDSPRNLHSRSDLSG